MDIQEACRTLRVCNEAFAERRQPYVRSAVAAKAVQVLKSHLQAVRADGRRIRELELAERVMFTPEGITGVMAYVLLAQTALPGSLPAGVA